MSTQIKIGDTVRRAGPSVGSCIHGHEYTVTDAHPGEIKIAGPPGWWSVAKFELATPAPIDPHAVKPGDTVVVRFVQTGDVVTTKAYRPEDIKAGRWVSVLGWPLVKADGTFGLAVKHFELLAHQPAPEPEPEYVVGGTIADIQVRGCHAAPMAALRAIRSEGGWRTSGGRFDDVNVETVRPLVVIDPVTMPTAAVLVGVYLEGFNSQAGRELEHKRAVGVRAILAHLGLGGAR